MGIVDQIRERQRARKKELSSIPTLEQILGLRLSELVRRGIAIKIHSEVLGCEIWLCGNERIAAQLRQDDLGAVIYTADEMRRLIKVNRVSEDLKGIHNAKTGFPGSKVVDSRLEEAIDEPDRT